MAASWLYGLLLPGRGRRPADAGATNNGLTTPLTIGDPAVVPDGNYEYELEFDANDTYLWEHAAARANNRSWVPIAIGTSGANRTVTVTGPLQHSAQVTLASDGVVATLVGNGNHLPGAGLPSSFVNGSGIRRPWGVAYDSLGTLFFTLWDDGSLCRDEGNSTSSKVVTGLSHPMGFDFFANDDVAIADFGNDRIVMATAASGYTNTETLTVPGFVIQSPVAVTVAPSGLLYIVNAGRHEILEFDPGTLTARRVAGTGVQGFSGDGGLATAAQLSYPTGVDVTAAGLLILTDGHNNRVRAVNLNVVGALTVSGVDVAAGEIETICGGGPVSTASNIFQNGTAGMAGDGRHGLAAVLDAPAAPRVHDGRIFFVDADNHRVRVIDEFGYLHHLAGVAAVPENNGFRSAQPSPGASLGDGGGGRLADINRPMGLCVREGAAPGLVDVTLADTDHLRIRRLVGVQFTTP